MDRNGEGMLARTKSVVYTVLAAILCFSAANAWFEPATGTSWYAPALLLALTQLVTLALLNGGPTTRRTERILMTERYVLLAEGNPNDELSMFRALRKQNIANDVVVLRDGQEAVDFLFGTGSYAERDASLLPQVLLLDLKLPKLSGLEVLGRIRADERTRTLPVVILTSSAMDRDIVDGYRLGVNSYVQKPVTAEVFNEAVQPLDLYWVLVNKVPTVV